MGKYFSICITIIFLLTNISVKNITLEDSYRFENNIEIDKEFQEKLKERKRLVEDTKHFFNTIGWLESRNRYEVKNGSYLGKYQLGRLAMKDIDLSISQRDFLVNPRIQENAMISLLYRNKSYLQRYIDEYAGTTFDDIYITEAGILAGAHLGGASSVKKYFDSGGRIVFRDGNGTPIRKYIKEFEPNKYFTLRNKSKKEIKKIIHNEFIIKSGTRETSKKNKTRR